MYIFPFITFLSIFKKTTTKMTLPMHRLGPKCFQKRFYTWLGCLVEKFFTDGKKMFKKHTYHILLWSFFVWDFNFFKLFNDFRLLVCCAIKCQLSSCNLTEFEGPKRSETNSPSRTGRTEHTDTAHPAISYPNSNSAPRPNLTP